MAAKAEKMVKKEGIGDVIDSHECDKEIPARGRPRRHVHMKKNTTKIESPVKIETQGLDSDDSQIDRKPDIVSRLRKHLKEKPITKKGTKRVSIVIPKANLRNSKNVRSKNVKLAEDKEKTKSVKSELDSQLEGGVTDTDEASPSHVKPEQADCTDDDDECQLITNEDEDDSESINITDEITIGNEEDEYFIVEIGVDGPATQSDSMVIGQTDLGTRTMHGTEGRPYSCDLCDRTFTHSFNLGRHLKTHTGEKPYRCFHCEMNFSTSATLTKHLKKHMSPEMGQELRPYHCPTCGMNFSRMNSLVRHERTHTGEKPFECEVCGKGFPQAAYLKAHMRNHTGEKPYKCEICEVSFKHSGYLNDHRRRAHTGEKPHQCGVCRKRFSRSSDMHRHEKTHLMRRDKPFNCDYCGKGFKLKTGLDNHKENKCPHLWNTTRDQKKPNVRETVDIYFDQAPATSQYGRKQPSPRKQLSPRKAEQIEELTDMEIDSADAEINKFDNENQELEMNGKREVQIDLSESNIDDIDEMRYKCETCNVMFREATELIEHCRQHKMPFRCLSCNISFAYSRNLIEHCKTVHAGEQYDYEIYWKRYSSADAKLTASFIEGRKHYEH